MRLSHAQETLLRRASWAQACLWDRGSRGGYEFRYRYGIRAPGTMATVASLKRRGLIAERQDPHRFWRINLVPTETGEKWLAEHGAPETPVVVLSSSPTQGSNQ